MKPPKLLKDGDRVRTGPGGKGHIRLAGALEGAEAIVAAATLFNVNELKRRRKASPLQLLFGAIRTRLIGFLGQRPIMATATATIGVKGTDFIVYVKRKKATGITADMITVSTTSKTSSKT